jgi:alkanesulfonate monooxygenase SsuD/methylene tetrahydromethanopterin reductase-like flavin-dependent oxidoreductase (luciferase family)
LSGGRLSLGLGAGWQQREHTNFGWQLLDIPARFARFEEGLEVISKLLASDEPVEFTGHYYALHDAILLPRPDRPGGPPILIGGNGEKRTLPLVVRYAQEWNGVFLTPARYAELSKHLDRLLLAEGREPDKVRRSLMSGCIFGTDADDLQRRLSEYKRTAAELYEQGVAAGTATQIVDQLGAWQAAGVQRIMLQWMDLDELDGLEAFAVQVLPQVSS